MSISVPDWIAKQTPPKATATQTPAAEVLQLLQEKPKTTVVLDLRNDRDPAILKNSVGIPATDLSGYQDVKSLVIDKITAANPDTSLIVVHCNSSRQRATLVAGWIQDYLDEHQVKDLEVTILQGGIAGWYQLDEPYKSFLVSYP